MFKTVVVGTDGSKNAQKALGLALDLGRDHPETSFHVVSALQPLSAHHIQEIKASLPAEFRDLIHARYMSDSILDNARQLFAAAGVDAEFHDMSDDPTDAILQIAESAGADLVVVGSRGEGVAARALHGSVSTKLIHHAPCSVLVVRPD